MPKAKPRDGTPSASEFGLLRAHLARSGVSQVEITVAIGGNVGGRDREAIVRMLREWLRTRPKG